MGGGFAAENLLRKVRIRSEYVFKRAQLKRGPQIRFYFIEI